MFELLTSLTIGDMITITVFLGGIVMGIAKVFHMVLDNVEALDKTLEIVKELEKETQEIADKLHSAQLDSVAMQQQIITIFKFAKFGERDKKQENFDLQDCIKLQENLKKHADD